MKFVKHYLVALLAVWLVTGLSPVGVANATFITEADGVVRDTVTGFEWDPIANRHPNDTWSQAVADASALTIDGGGFHLALIGELQGLYNDLVAAGDCTGTNCTGSIGGFTGIQPSYWSGTESTPGSIALVLTFGNGTQHLVNEVTSLDAAWAVRPADVDAVRTPEPASLLLIGAGMLGLGWARRARRRR